MFRLWGKIWTDNHMMKDTVICNDTDDTRTHKIFQSLEEICYLWDLSNRSGWTIILWILNATIKPGLPPIILLRRSILIIWKLK